MNTDLDLPEIEVRPLLHSALLRMHDTFCRGRCRHPSAEEYTKTTQLIFPYRGVYVRHVGDEQTVAEPNQVLFFNAEEGYKVSHPVAGGDASLTLILNEAQLLELAPRDLLRRGKGIAFRPRALRIDPHTQLLAAQLRQRFQSDEAEPLEAETLALTLVRRSLGVPSATEPRASYGLRRLVDRIKLVIGSNLARRWTLSEIAAEIKGSPVYLTQVFQQVEGVPLYRYQLNMRLARALDLLGEYSDLTSLAFDLGFSSHSHFTAAFRRHYGLTPTAFKQSPAHR